MPRHRAEILAPPVAVRRREIQDAFDPAPQPARGRRDPQPERVRKIWSTCSVCTSSMGILPTIGDRRRTARSSATADHALSSARKVRATGNVFVGDLGRSVGRPRCLARAVAEARRWSIGSNPCPRSFLASAAFSRAAWSDTSATAPNPIACALPREYRNTQLRDPAGETTSESPAPSPIAPGDLNPSTFRALNLCCAMLSPLYSSLYKPRVELYGIPWGCQRHLSVPKPRRRNGFLEGCGIAWSPRHRKRVPFSELSKKGPKESGSPRIGRI